MATVVSLINMKGGVGKTTLALQIAFRAATTGRRVLLVDLDPQSNLSQAILQPEPYLEYLKSRKPTVVQVFEGYRPPTTGSPSPKPIDVKEAVVKNAGKWPGSRVDLIPSRLELSRTLRHAAGTERRLAKAIAKIEHEYDLILIDCAPTESALTEAAYFASRFVLVPIKPEFMATIGLPLLAQSLAEFKLENEDHELDICGLVFNRSSAYSRGPEDRNSVADVKQTAQVHGWRIYHNQVRYSASYAKSAREGVPIARTSNVRNVVVNSFAVFADEFFQSIGLGG